MGSLNHYELYKMLKFDHVGKWYTSLPKPSTRLILNGDKQISIESFLSPRHISIPGFKNPVSPIYQPIASCRIIWFIPFPRVLDLWEMQTVSSRVWTRVTEAIFYDGNHCTSKPWQMVYEQIRIGPRKFSDTLRYKPITKPGPEKQT